MFKIYSPILLSFCLLVYSSCNYRCGNDDIEPSANILDETENKKEGWTCLTANDSTFVNKMAYATDDNFLKEQIYPCAQCWLREEAAEGLLKAQEEAMGLGYRIVFFDCYRPTPLQAKMFAIFPDPKYVAEPQKGSIHNKGCAVDISLATEEGELLEMGTSFDDFSEKAHPDYEELPSQVLGNRKLLAGIMKNAGFEPYKYEWWHYNFKTKEEYENEDFLWSCE